MVSPGVKHPGRPGIGGSAHRAAMEQRQVARRGLGQIIPEPSSLLWKKPHEQTGVCMCAWAARIPVTSHPPCPREPQVKYLPSAEREEPVGPQGQILHQLQNEPLRDRSKPFPPGGGSDSLTFTKSQPKN